MSKEKILIVEDDPMWGDTLEDVLGSDAEVVVVSSAKEACQALKEDGFTRIISDGLEGDWRGVKQGADEFCVPMKLLSGDIKYRREAERQGIEFCNKGNFDLDDL